MSLLQVNRSELKEESGRMYALRTRHQQSYLARQL
jgi:hypothetical protein